MSMSASRRLLVTIVLGLCAAIAGAYLLLIGLHPREGGSGESSSSLIESGNAAATSRSVPTAAAAPAELASEATAEPNEQGEAAGSALATATAGAERQSVRVTGPARTLENVRRLSSEFQQAPTASTGRTLVENSIAVILDQAGRYEEVTERNKTIRGADWPKTTDRMMFINKRQYAVSFAEFPVLEKLSARGGGSPTQRLSSELIAEVEGLVAKALAQAPK